MKLALPVFIGILLILFSVQPIQALDFTIQTATLSGNIIDITTAISGATNTNCPNQTCYLFAAMRQGNGNYFGETQNNQGEWIIYTNRPEKEFIKTSYYLVNITDGNWNGIVKMRFHPANSDYTGPGDYTLTLMRFTGNSQSPAGDSPTAILTLAEPLPSPNPSPEVSPSPTASAASPNPSISLGVIDPSPSSSPTPSPSKIYRVKEIALLNLSPEPVLGTHSGESRAKSRGKPDWQLITMLVFTGAGLLLAVTFIIVRLWRKN